MSTVSVALRGPALLPDDILSAILAIAKKASGGPRYAFRGHDSKLQKVFRELRREVDSPLLEVFVFSDRGPVPFSPVLNESISRLQLAGLIGRENPDYEVLFLRRAAEDYFDTVLRSRFSSEELAQLDMIAGKFLERIPPLG